jgi:signal transduction histidine kinase
MSSKEPKADPAERERTDESLTSERRKTDDELEKRSARYEESADDVVSEARQRADEVLQRARALADEKLACDGVDADVHAVVRAERRREDRALDEERSVGDLELASEREGHHRALAALLDSERVQTDSHLLAERESSDGAVSTRDDFLAIVSHDLRNMIGGVSMSAAALLRLQCEDDRARGTIVREAERIQRHTARMTRLVGDLLDLVSIQAGRLAVLPQSREATELLRETQDVFEPIAAAKGISVRTEVRAVSLPARYDHERILQVLANLVGNALKFTPRGGRIDVVAEPVANEIRFAIADSGRGMAAAQLENIFDRFWQHSKNGSDGLGLGLYISRCIVEAHGGRIWAESRMGEGSTFYFTLPAGGATRK